MGKSLFHIYRNTPFGRETLLQSIYFCRQLELALNIYIPKEKQFLMYFDNNTVNVELDASYFKYGDMARANAESILADTGMPATFFEPANQTASNLPDVPSDFDFMTCPRIISDLSTKIGLGKIGSKVRDILHNAHFPVLIPSQCFKKWKSVTVLFGGSIHSLKALHLGLQIAELTGLPLDIFTQADKGGNREAHEKILEQRNLAPGVSRTLRNWHFFDQGDFTANLFAVPHDALVILGIIGHGKIKKMLFGSNAEIVQSTLPNSLLLIGPEFEKDFWAGM